MAVVDALTAKLIDRETGLFEWPERRERVHLYQTGLRWPMIATVIDGLSVEAPWHADYSRTKSATLFRALSGISTSWSAFYIKHQDEAYAVIDWVRQLPADRVNATLLLEFETNPAEQGGASFLGLFPEAEDDLVLFHYAPGEFFRISLFGAMQTAVPRALEPLGPP